MLDRINLNGSFDPLKSLLGLMFDVLYYLSVCSFQRTCYPFQIRSQRCKLPYSSTSVDLLPLIFLCMSGSHLSSRAVSSRVFSAARVLTIVFGMGTGVSPGRIATRHFLGYLDNQIVHSNPLLSVSLERR